MAVLHGAGADGSVDESRLLKGASSWILLNARALRSRKLPLRGMLMLPRAGCPVAVLFGATFQEHLDARLPPCLETLIGILNLHLLQNCLSGRTG